MRKLLLAFALLPAVSQAALVIDSGKAATAAPPHINVSPTVATPAIATPASTAALAPTQLAPIERPKAIDVAPIWRIEPNDNTFQALFARWSRIAGWTFIWDVDQDIPLVGRDTFNTSFTDAVLKVAHSTDYTDLPIHPCFYSQTPPLVRIVPISVVCNPENE
jgi:hypothetical protein